MLRGVVYRRFETTYRSLLRGSSSSELLDSIVDLLVKGMLGRMGGPILPFVRHFQIIYTYSRKFVKTEYSTV